MVQFLDNSLGLFILFARDVKTWRIMPDQEVPENDGQNVQDRLYSKYDIPLFIFLERCNVFVRRQNHSNDCREENASLQER